MDAGEVHYKADGAVARITFAREKARNAMTWKMYDELEDACQQARDDDRVRVVVLRGEGDRAFIAGTDISQFADFETGDDGIEYEERIERILRQLEELPKPTIAVIEGYAVGGGLTIAAVCDLRLCSTSAKFGMPVARTLGNCLSMANYARLAWLLGPSNVKALVLRADFIDAQSAATMGFATEVHTPEALGDRVNELAEQLANQAPLTIWATKESIRRLMLDGLPEGNDVVRKVYGSQDFKEGNAAFVEKRPPRWQGT